MEAPITELLDVPGARLHTEVRGSGPLLLFVVGGNGDSTVFGGVAARLADRFTVVTYDRRGFVRSPLDGPADGPVDDGARLATDADDVRRLVERFGDGPAHVFGSSSGAIVVLEVAARHPEILRTAVPHEPPVSALVTDADTDWNAFFDSVYDTYRTSGFESAMLRFSTGVGLADQQAAPPSGFEPPPGMAAMMERSRANSEFWFEHELRQYPRYAPDLDALAAVRDRLVLAVGNESRASFPSRPNLALAQRLGLQVADMPGGHVGYLMRPAEFAPRLVELLA